MDYYTVNVNLIEILIIILFVLILKKKRKVFYSFLRIKLLFGRKFNTSFLSSNPSYQTKKKTEENIIMKIPIPQEFSGICITKNMYIDQESRIYTTFQ